MNNVNTVPYIISSRFIQCLPTRSWILWLHYQRFFTVTIGLIKVTWKGGSNAVKEYHWNLLYILIYHKSTLEQFIHTRFASLILNIKTDDDCWPSNRATLWLTFSSSHAFKPCACHYTTALVWMIELDGVRTLIWFDFLIFDSKYCFIVDNKFKGFGQ